MINDHIAYPEITRKNNSMFQNIELVSMLHNTWYLKNTLSFLLETKKKHIALTSSVKYILTGLSNFYFMFINSVYSTNFRIYNVRPATKPYLCLVKNWFYIFFLVVVLGVWKTMAFTVCPVLSYDRSSDGLTDWRINC